VLGLTAAAAHRHERDCGRDDGHEQLGGTDDRGLAHE
jgi:hypothetical protein